MRIALLVEGETEKVFIPYVREFLEKTLPGNMPRPRLTTIVYKGRIPKEEKPRRSVESLLRDGADYVIALTDVYTGTNDFVDAADAKRKMHGWVGKNDRFHPHAAQHDFEAWLLPYWDEIKKLAQHNKGRPAGPPESVNLNHPPSWHIKEVFGIGKGPRDYIKTRDAKRLKGKDLRIAADACPQLKAFLNTIMTLSGAGPI